MCHAHRAALPQDGAELSDGRDLPCAARETRRAHRHPMSIAHSSTVVSGGGRNLGKPSGSAAGAPVDSAGNPHADGCGDGDHADPGHCDAVPLDFMDNVPEGSGPLAAPVTVFVTLAIMLRYSGPVRLWGPLKVRCRDRDGGTLLLDRLIESEPRTSLESAQEGSPNGFGSPAIPIRFSRFRGTVQ